MNAVVCTTLSFSQLPATFSPVEVALWWRKSIPNGLEPIQWLFSARIQRPFLCTWSQDTAEETSQLQKAFWGWLRCLLKLHQILISPSAQFCFPHFHKYFVPKETILWTSYTQICDPESISQWLSVIALFTSSIVQIVVANII